MKNEIPKQGAIPKIPCQGEIWLADFNRKKVKEQSKIRPVLILSNNWQNQYNRYAVVAPLTSEEERLSKKYSPSTLIYFMLMVREQKVRLENCLI